MKKEMARSKSAQKKPTSKKRQELREKAKHRVKAVATGGSKRATGHAGGFFDFIRTQGVIGLAVGLAIGAAAGDTVKKIVEGFINPVVQFIVGSQERLNSSTWTFEAFGRTAEFAWGAALSSLITLVATALVIYWLVHIFKLDKLDKKKK